MRNTGKKSEEIFDDYWKGFGKEAFVHVFADSSKISGLNKNRIFNVPKQPSDRLVTFRGETFYAEVKSTVNKTSFSFKDIQPNQLGKSKQILAAGGKYLFFIHNLNSNTWYRVPASIIHQILNEGKKSVKWADIGIYKCTLM